MKLMDLGEIEAVSGGRVVKEIAVAIISSGFYDVLKPAALYLMANSHMGRGGFPPVPRAGRE